MSAAAPLPIRDETPPPLTVVEPDLVYPTMRAEAAECTCPEFCERDHDLD
jgi:hypothetical protein